MKKMNLILIWRVRLRGEMEHKEFEEEEAD